MQFSRFQGIGSSDPCCSVSSYSIHGAVFYNGRYQNDLEVDDSDPDYIKVKVIEAMKEQIGEYSFVLRIHMNEENNEWHTHAESDTGSKYFKLIVTH